MESGGERAQHECDAIMLTLQDCYFKQPIACALQKEHTDQRQTLTNRSHCPVMARKRKVQNINVKHCRVSSSLAHPPARWYNKRIQNLCISLPVYESIGKPEKGNWLAIKEYIGERKHLNLILKMWTSEGPVG